MALDTIEEIDETIRDLEKYRNALKWSKRNENAKGVWDEADWKNTVLKAKAEVSGKKTEIINKLKEKIK